MQFRVDRDVNALYIALRPGQVSKTVELNDSVYVDVDEQDEPIGIEIVNADEFVPFLRNHADDATIPPRISELFSVIAD